MNFYLQLLSNGIECHFKYIRRRKDTYRDSRDFSPWKASAAIFFIWLLLRSLRMKHIKELNVAVDVRNSDLCVWHEYHSHSSQFSIWRESLEWNFRNAILFQPPASNYGKTNYTNKLANLHIYVSGSFTKFRDNRSLSMSSVLFHFSLLFFAFHAYTKKYCLYVILSVYYIHIITLD